MITGTPAVEVGETGGPLARESEQSIGSEATGENGWNSVTCGGALTGTESKEYVIVQDVVYVNKQQLQVLTSIGAFGITVSLGTTWESE